MSSHLTSLARIFAWVVCLGFATCILLQSLGGPVGMFDEPAALVGSSLVARGLTPHVDFWNLYPPGGYFLGAWAQSVLGPSALAQRILGAALLGGLLWLAGATVASSLFLRLMTVLGCVCFVADAFAQPAWSAYALSIGSLLLYLRASAARRWRWAGYLAAGSLAGIAALCRINFGAYAAAAVCCDMAIGGADAGKGGAVRREWAAFLAPVALLPALYVIAYGSAWRIVVEQILIAPARLIHTHRFIPFVPVVQTMLPIVFPLLWLALRGPGRSKLKWAAVGLAVIFGAAAVALGGRPWMASALPLAEIAALVWAQFRFRMLDRVEFVLLVEFILLLHYFLSRTDESHLFVFTVLLGLLLPRLLEGLLRESGATLGRTLAAVCSVAVIAAIPIKSVGVIPDPSRIRAGLELVADLAVRRTDGARLLSGPAASRWQALYPDRDELAAIRYIRQHAAVGEAVYVAMQDSASGFVNDVRAYWLLDRPIPVSHYIFDPGIDTEAGVQAATISELRRSRVKWVLLRENLQGDWAFVARNYSGSHLLDEFIRREYRGVRAFGPYLVLSAPGQSVGG
jgi:hypothetical protein